LIKLGAELVAQAELELQINELPFVLVGHILDCFTMLHWQASLEVVSDAIAASAGLDDLLKTQTEIIDVFCI